MKKNTLSLLRIATATGLALGTFTISALAVDWKAPTCTAPNFNADAPINIGTNPQYKVGALAIGKNASSTVL